MSAVPNRNGRSGSVRFASKRDIYRVVDRHLLTSETPAFKGAMPVKPPDGLEVLTVRVPSRDRPACHLRLDGAPEPPCERVVALLDGGASK